MPKKTLGFCGVICVLCAATPAEGDSHCGAGYYLENGNCQRCQQNYEPYYCPGDYVRYACPTTDTDYNALSGWTVTVRNEGTWANRGATNIRGCRSSMHFLDENGSYILTEFPYNGTNYWGTSPDYVYYYAAGAGHYLSPYKSTSSEVWYYGTKPCTNAPAHAHYTGPGTPDSPDGTVTDANDCPWACDTGYSRVGDVCAPLCTIGITHIRAGDATVPLFATRHTTPSLVVRTAGGICYGNLSAGPGTGINIRVDGTTYHLE